ncbi:MAG: SusC/RagA family TonB-linked outer membrane protein, partial [Tannerella sp.]|nr:SusC/RagA family TonB-linked outer membrane protein [Tannerella sp.]
MKQVFIYLLLPLSCLFLAQASAAQGNTVGGQVLDSGSGEALTGVSVVVKGTQRGTVTNSDGYFSIAASPEETLQFSYVGYTPAEQPAGTRKNLRILLSEAVAELEELVVVGYGVQRKLSSVGSISQTRGETLVSAGSGTSLTQALQGVLPGVISINTTSKPGADASEILIRGRSSWVGDGSPLTLIDGVERDFNDIDPNEVETLSVLKDASATAVYGIKGANGVILVTTKRGSKRKPVINFSANYGLKQPTAKPDYADYITTMNLFNEAARNDGQWSSLIPESTVAAWENAFATGNVGPYNAVFPEIDWWDEMTQTGHEENYNINVSGGSDFMKYFLSLGYFYSGDIFKSQKNDLFDPSFWYRRYNWRGNFDFSITPVTQLSVNLAGKQGYRNQTGYRIGNTNDAEDGYGQSSFFETIYTAARHTFPIRWEDGSYGVQSNGLGNLLNNFDKGQRTYKYYQNFIDIVLKQDLKMLTPGLSASAKFSYNATSNTTSRIQRYKGSIFAEGNYIAWYRDYDYSRPLPGGGYALNSEKRWANDVFQGDSQEASYDNIMQGGYEKRLYYECALNYARSFAGHHVSALALFNRSEIDGLYSYSGTELHFPDKEEAWVGRLTYIWNERYLTELNGSYTGSQKFRRGMRFTFLPSVSVGWRISEEPWLKQYTEKILTNMKVRYSYGMVGYDKSASPFTYFQTYENAGGNGSWKDNGIVRLGSEGSTLTAY